VETQEGERLANFQYAAPEQRVRGRPVTFQADIYAFGLILNQMFTGEILQGAAFKPIGSVAPSHGYLDDVVKQMVLLKGMSRDIFSPAAGGDQPHTLGLDIARTSAAGTVSCLLAYLTTNI